MFRFQNLEIYLLARELTIYCYRITKKLPDSERFALTNQINRAAISVPSNIAEGVSRKTIKDKAHFMNIAYASLAELVCQFDICQKLGYIDQAEENEFQTLAKNLVVKLSNYAAYLKKTEG